jgi:pectin methylesterase-like acyl-CoA thioesterase
MLFSFNSKLVVMTASLIIAVQSKDIYVSSSGTGSGSQTAPYGSIQAAVNAAVAGDIILLRAGTYKPATNIQITKSGTATSPITLRSYQEEKVILDGESLPG